MKRGVGAFLLAAILLLMPVVCLAGPFDLVARAGMHSDDVSHIQLLLSHLGFYRGALDSRFGPETVLAVEAFERSFGLPEDGIVTEQLMRRLVRHAKRAASKKPTHYVRELTMEATAYTSEDPGCGLYTYGGNRLRWGLVAVDPSVIPLGTRLFVSGYGMAIADDTGGDIKGNRIDLAYDSRADAFKFGRRMLTVYILE